MQVVISAEGLIAARASVLLDAFVHIVDVHNHMAVLLELERTRVAQVNSSATVHGVVVTSQVVEAAEGFGAFNAREVLPGVAICFVVVVGKID